MRNPFIRRRIQSLFLDIRDNFLGKYARFSYKRVLRLTHLVFGCLSTLVSTSILLLDTKMQ